MPGMHCSVAPWDGLAFPVEARSGVLDGQLVRREEESAVVRGDAVSAAGAHDDAVEVAGERRSGIRAGAVSRVVSVGGRDIVTSRTDRRMPTSAATRVPVGLDPPP